jgi:hypothetical protein
MDSAQKENGDPMMVARKLLGAGAQTALATLAGEGCLAVRGRRGVCAFDPQVEVIDGCGAPG